MNIPLLREIQDQIISTPEKLDMLSYFDSQTQIHTDLEVARAQIIHDCDTTACISGWALALRPEVELSPIIYFGGCATDLEATACRALDITEDQGRLLFHLGEWPDQFADDYMGCEGSPKAQAKVAYDRIEHFIQTGGAE